MYRWVPERPPVGVVLALHGLVMHGQAFDALGKTLAEKGFLVYSTDMRGYGRLKREYPHEFCSPKDCKQKINYEKSSHDLSALAVELRSSHPGLPFFIVGESLGADMGLCIASRYPDVADGLVLAAPAIRAYTFLDSHAPMVCGQIMRNFRTQLDMRPYLKRYASTDPDIQHELAADPMVRRRLSAWELLQSHQTVMKSLSYVPKIRPDKPVLVLQSSDDRCVKPRAVRLLLSRLRSRDQQVKYLDKRGHILIETCHIKPDTMSIILTWLTEHVNTVNQLQAQKGPSTLLVSTEQKPEKE